MPPNTEVAKPANVTWRGGRASLHVELATAQVDALRSAPVVVAVGDADRLTGAAMSPKLVLQVNAQKISVDESQPTMALARANRVDQARLLASLTAERDAMTNGSSTWFGDRQLKAEQAQLTSQLAASTAALAGPLAAAESAFQAAPDMNVAFSLPDSTGADRDALVKAASDAANLRASVVQLEAKRAAFESVPSELPSIDADLAAARAQADAAEAGVHGRLSALYAKLRAEQPDVADRWLLAYVTMSPTPGTSDLQTLLSDRRGLRRSLAINEEDLAHVTAQELKNRQPRIDQLSAQIAQASKALADADARITGLSAGSIKNVQTFATTSDFTRSFI
jgi:hypothetical protein